MKVAILADDDPNDAATWSGIPQQAATALQEIGVDVVVPQARVIAWLSNRLEWRLRLVGLSWKASRPYAWLRSWSARTSLRTLQPDFVIGFDCRGVVAELSRYYPAAYVGDATVRQLQGYYPGFWSSGATSTFDRMHKDEATTHRRSRAVFYASDWAAKAAIEASPSIARKVHVVPFGASVTAPANVNAERRERGLRLLWCGVDWERKGGDVAVETLRIVRARGLDASLDVIGVSRPPGLEDQDHVIFHGRLNKSVRSERRLLDDLYASAFIFLLPSKAEAFGIVFAEAAAFGIPVVAYETGGVPSSVEDGGSGVLLGVDASPTDFAELVIKLWNEPAEWQSYSRRAVELHREELNWTAWARRVRAALADSADQTRSTDARESVRALEQLGAA